MVDVVSGRARGRPRDAPVALELDERPLVPVHLQQHRVPDPHRGRGLDARQRGGGGAPGSPPSSICSSAYRRRDRDGAREGGGWLPRVARGGAARSARSRHCRRRAAHKTFSLGRSHPVSPSVIRTGHVSFCRAFKRRAPPSARDVRASRRDAPAVRPLRPHPRPERARDRPRSDGRGGGNATGRVRGGGEGWGGGGPRDRPRRRPPRRAPPPDPTPRQPVARAELLEMDARLERSGRGRVGER